MPRQCSYFAIGIVDCSGQSPIASQTAVGLFLGNVVASDQSRLQQLDGDDYCYVCWQKAVAFG